jgi:ABC-type nitrate/sulfonate/bicarbonate transport system substrate-binding protein
LLKTKKYVHSVLAPGLLAAILCTACGGTSAPPSAASPSASAPAKPAESGSAKPQASAPSAASPSASAAAKPQTGKLPSIKVAYTTVTATVTPLWMADALGAFEKHGVSVTLVTMASAAATPALLSHEIDAFGQSAAPVITADLNGQVDEIYVGNVANRNTQTLYTAKDIKSAADLKGKQVANDRPGTPTDFFTRRMLTKAGLKTTDVVIRQLGGSEVSIPALISGQVQAAATGPTQSFRMEDDGYPAIATVVGDPYVGHGYVVLRSRMEELAPALPGFLAAVSDAVKAYKEQPDLAKKIIAQYTKETDASVLQRTYDFYLTKAPFDASLRPSVDGFQEILDYLGDTSIPAAKNAKPQQFYDERFLAQISRS